ncbi:MAG TPA: hypothetical protein VHS59_06205, partial [Bacillota bacterium]|nr:hypothetical protein [Bacillota bacterium]
AFARSFCGRTQEVIVEQPVNTPVSDPLWDLSEGQQLFEGLTGNYLRVIFPARPEQQGELVRVAIQHFRQGCLHGQILD